jgi:hypothetical protein
MKMLGKISLLFICCATLAACTVTNPFNMRPYLCKTYTLKQDMYVCEIQYRVPTVEDRYYMRDPHIFNAICEDSMFNLAYRDKSAVWPQGHGDFREREWLIAKLPRGTHFYLNEYNVPNQGRQSNWDGQGAFSDAVVTISSGKFKGLRVEWPWFDFEREIDRPVYPDMGKPLHY